MKNLVFIVTSFIFLSILIFFIYADFGSEQPIASNTELYIDEENTEKQSEPEDTGWSMDMFVPIVNREPYNGELQNYVGSQVKVDGNKIIFTAEQGHDEYVSGKVESAIAFRYGTFSFKVNKIREHGLFPAIWMLPVNHSLHDEVDIYEAIGRDPDIFYGVHHWGHDQTRSRDFFKYFYAGDTSKVITFEWTEDKMEWFYDGVSIYRMDNDIPDSPMYMIMNLAVGGKWAQAPNQSTQFPADFEVEIIEFSPKEVVRR